MVPNQLDPDERRRRLEFLIKCVGAGAALTRLAYEVVKGLAGRHG